MLGAEIHDGSGPRRLTEPELVSFIMLLAGAGVETVARLLSWAAVTLARHPDQRQVLVDDPSLIPGAVEELLRYEAPSPVNGRWTLRPYRAHGVEIPAGTKVLLLIGSANRDRREFDDPDRFDVRRVIKRLISFGHARSFYQIAAKDTSAIGPSINYVRGDRIQVAFVNREVQTVTIKGQATGIYLDPSKPPRDTTKKGTDTATVKTPNATPKARADTARRATPR